MPEVDGYLTKSAARRALEHGVEAVGLKDPRISDKAMVLLKKKTDEILEKIAEIAAMSCKNERRKTVLPRDIEMALKAVLSQ